MAYHQEPGSRKANCQAERETRVGGDDVGKKSAGDDGAPEFDGKSGTREKAQTLGTQSPKPPDPPEPPGPPQDQIRAGWRNDLATSQKGTYVACLSNLITILANEPDWQGVLAFNEFTSQIIKLKDPPWRADDRSGGKHAGPWTDADGIRAAAWITREWEDIRPNAHQTDQAIRVVAERKMLHPVRDWLKDLKWDGASRADTWLINYAGASDNEYTRKVASMFLIGAVARAFDPGCKVDHTLILEGKTGKGKSTLLETLAGREWFLETEVEVGSKDFYQLLRGKWIVELAELDSINRGELTRVKAVLTKRVDTYRESYGRYSKDFPRQCVFTGTTEEDTYLRDEKGNRRFLGVDTSGELDIEGLGKAREQIWAEAVARYLKGEKWFVTDPALKKRFEQEAERRRVRNPWEERMSTFLARVPARWEKGVTTAEVLKHLSIEERDQTVVDQMKAASLLRMFGWERTRGRDWAGEREYRYFPSEEAVAKLRATDEERRAKECADAEGKLSHLADKLEAKAGVKKTAKAERDKKQRDKEHEGKRLEFTPRKRPEDDGTAEAGGLPEDE
jgi:putative DNA primase/helicase